MAIKETSMKVILITGISSGLGLAIAERLVKCNYSVYGTTRKEIVPISGINHLIMDVTSSESINQAIEKILVKEGRIDVLINNAGMGIAGPVELTGIDDIQLQLNVNFLGVVRVTQAVLPIMRQQSKGMIISISSIGGLIGLPFQGFYSASKFAIEGFCQSLYHEVKNNNIKVVVINPGDFATHFTANRIYTREKDCHTFYQDYSQTLLRIKCNEQKGLCPEILAKKIEKLIKRTNPSTRYIIATPMQKASVYLKTLIPEKLFLKIISRYYFHG